jgi:hypothetical protein
MSKIFEDDRYIESIVNHIQETIRLLQEYNSFFSIAVNKDGIEFNPPLPEDIVSNFSPFTILAIHNYTFDTLEIIDDKIRIEAGFGSENIGSVLTIPCCAILQIIVDEMIILSNPSAPLTQNFSVPKIVSKNSFKQNPNNKRFF